MTEVNLNEYTIDSDGKGNVECLVGLIGCGNMAYAIAAGLIKKGLNSNRIIVSGQKKSSFHSGWEALEIKRTLKNIDVLNASLITIICCKPNNLKDVADDIENTVDKKTDLKKYQYYNKTLISILAGVSLETLRNAFKWTYPMEILRAMPNTPLQVGLGAVAMTPSESQNTVIVEQLFKLLGMIEFIDESKFDAITGLSGSGPAYIYMIIEAMTDAAVREGLPCDFARKFAAQTVLGTAKTVLETGKHPAQLKNEVCSPGGTTIQAVYELEKGGLRMALMNAVQASSQKSRDMNKKS